MPYETDNRLKSYLDTNQLAREQMCLSILSVQKDFSDVKPRHPRGGPDGGRDIEATYLNMKVFGAVGFINQACDSNENLREIKRKFIFDFDNAISGNETFEYFIFFTNVNLTISDRDELIDLVVGKGYKKCDIFYRERIRIVLDSPEGFHIRFHFLNIALTPEEQSAFFNRWGEDIQGVISSGFTKIENTLARILFLQEVNEPMKYLFIILHLDREYTAKEIGHFRAFCSLHFIERKNNTMFLLFGCTDNLNRKIDKHKEIKKEEYCEGIIGGQWKKEFIEGESESEHDEKYKLDMSFSRIFEEKRTALGLEYRQSDFIRLPPYFLLRDFNDASFVLMTNEKLAYKIKSISIYADGYKLLEKSNTEFGIDKSEFEKDFPVEFSTNELNDKWVRIRPNVASTFSISFSEVTPKRIFESCLIQDK
jgi:hypothetical protein